MSEDRESIFDDDVGTKIMDRPGLDREDDTEEPKRYKVVFLNDDYTPMEWVSKTLMYHFLKTEGEAEAITLQIHKTGKGIAGIYPKDIAITKSIIVNEEARGEGHPLLTEVEEE
jgi:ATP-dependent Clp protease adaptor protein ClpS